MIGYKFKIKFKLETVVFPGTTNADSRALIREQKLRDIRIFYHVDDYVNIEKEEYCLIKSVLD